MTDWHTGNGTCKASHFSPLPHACICEHACTPAHSTCEGREGCLLAGTASETAALTPRIGSHGHRTGHPPGPPCPVSVPEGLTGLLWWGMVGAPQGGQCHQGLSVPTRAWQDLRMLLMSSIPMSTKGTRAGEAKGPPWAARGQGPPCGAAPGPPGTALKSSQH